ncbi:hypothetical protein DDT54_05300 [Brenneria nigrifluens DSM 30175 = ATCC 13028]|uniref:Uncharacterized protein n=1 Tax=Brenneria nigrifluens DSM 30175 = ATCC 13028 TaxID=1121120 RepID=A0A2U1UUH0_9GAMM|nr:hypothetical protein DDT54_05300 [Brenneria nigrifluens DSM 30175 = ATCC 13028]
MAVSYGCENRPAPYGILSACRLIPLPTQEETWNRLVPVILAAVGGDLFSLAIGVAEIPACAGMTIAGTLLLV